MRHETIASIERMRRFEGFARASLQKKARISAPAGSADDFTKDCLPDTEAKKPGARAHGFDLASAGIQFLECPAPARNAACPRHPERDLRRAKAFDCECMHVAGWRVAVHAGEVFGNEQPNLG